MRTIAVMFLLLAAACSAEPQQTTPDEGAVPGQDGGVQARDASSHDFGGPVDMGVEDGGSDASPDALCAEDERVESNMCVACRPGASSPAGNDSKGADTSCEAVVCDLDEHVVANACEPCPPGTSTPAGDDATGVDTDCDSVICGLDQHVWDNQCQDCPVGGSRPAGDDASGPNTRCDDRCTAVLGVMCTEFAAAYAKASNPDDDDHFGSAVAVSGDTIVVSASGEQSASAGIDGNQLDNSLDDAGAVYVFRETDGAWAQEAYIKASNPADGARFGYSVSLDGDTLVVGARGEASSATGVNGNQADVASPGAGAVYVFARSGTTWSQQAYIKASNTDADDWFGSSVSLDGDDLAVGAPNEASAATGVGGEQNDNTDQFYGAVYLFRRTGTAWAQTQYIKPSSSASRHRFGTAVALDAGTLAVGAPEDWSAIPGDPTDVSARDAGAVWVFAENGGVWTEQAYLKHESPDADDFFGDVVSLSGDTLAVGAPDEDGGSIMIDGDETDDSAEDAGAVVIFTRSGNLWTQQAYIKPSNTDARDHFGDSISLDGDLLAVGAPTEDSDSSGLVLTAFEMGLNTRDNSGAVYLYQRTGSTWVEHAYIKARQPRLQHRFGDAVALSGGLLVASKPNDQSTAAGIDGNDTGLQGYNNGGAHFHRVAP